MHSTESIQDSETAFLQLLTLTNTIPDKSNPVGPFIRLLNNRQRSIVV